MLHASGLSWSLQGCHSMHQLSVLCYRFCLLNSDRLQAPWLLAVSWCAHVLLRRRHRPTRYRCQSFLSAKCSWWAPSVLCHLRSISWLHAGSYPFQWHRYRLSWSYRRISSIAWQFSDAIHHLLPLIPLWLVFASAYSASQSQGCVSPSFYWPFESVLVCLFSNRLK